MKRRSSPAGLVLGILAIMAVTVAIQAIAAAVGWGTLALGVAIYLVVRRSKRK